jgi:tetratricopeptide (TPR) repeat protein
VKGSIDGQIGVVQYLRKKNEEAEPLLAAASMQHYIAKAMLGILQWKRGEKKKAKETFELALKAGKKESLLYAVYAYVLLEMGDREKAIEILNKGLGICKGDERLITNRNLLQNKQGPQDEGLRGAVVPVPPGAPHDPPGGPALRPRLPPVHARLMPPCGIAAARRFRSIEKTLFYSKRLLNRSLRSTPHVRPQQMVHHQA